MIDLSPYHSAALHAGNRRTAVRTALRAPCWYSHASQLMTGHIVDISACGARIETQERPAFGTKLMLRHAVGGPIGGTVARHYADGFAIAMPMSENSVAFMLKVVSAHMTRFDTEEDR